MLKTILPAILLLLLVTAPIAMTGQSAPRFPHLLNMVHHNPGEPHFETRFTQPEYIRDLGYTGQVPKIELQCGLTYDAWRGGGVP